MATFFDESVWCDVPLLADDETNVWGQAESTLATAAQLRAGPEMDSAKVAVLGRGTAVRLLQRCVGATGALRVRVRDANAVTGWLTSRCSRRRRRLRPRRSPRAEFVPGVTAEGVSFLRTRVGAVGVPDAETPVLVVLHGTSYNAGVWIPTFKRLHEVWASENLSFEAWIVEWAGHGRSRAVACPDIDVDRYELTREGPFDICCHAELEAPGTFGGIVVIEPILFPPLDKPPSGAADASGLIKGTLVKKKHFDVPSEDGVVDYLTKTAMGKQWEGEAVRSFVAHGRGLVGELAGLDAEATTYLGNCVVLKKCDHYVPMENSAWCASFVAAALASTAGPTTPA
ncbi:hypothetical protein JL720_16281 [Aureococcus anophagefferens]|nr:hypothetical protein JL720_16281 [Aureococcus anophagefferens]